MNPNEVEFLGEQNLVTIIPNFSYPVIHLLCGSFGPFQGGMPIKIPIWMALQLKQKQKCRIVAPDWMDYDNLKEMIELEKREKLCTEPPSEHFIDEAHMILNAGCDDIPNVDAIRTAIKDIWDIRTSKIRSTIDKFFKNELKEYMFVEITNVTLMELNNLRPMVPHALDQIIRIKSVKEPRAQNSQSQSNL